LSHSRADGVKLFNEGRRFFDAGSLPAALDLLGRAHAILEPDAASARWLAEAQLVAGAVEQAWETVSAAMVRHPSDVALTIVQAEVALKRGTLACAASTLNEALERRGDDAALLAQLGRVRFHAGEWRQAVGVLRESLKLQPHDLSVQSALIVAASYDPGMTTRRLKRLQREWGNSAPPVPARQWRHDSGRRNRPLRVGYVSCAFYHHAAASVFAPILLNHDPGKIETYLYSSSRRRDWLTVRLRLAAARWTSIAGLDDREAADLIYGDAVDILVDLDGHFPRNRLGVFALRPAPVQVSGWGYVAGPGIPGIDSLFTDGIIVPHNEESFFPEAITRLSCAQPYDAGMPQVPAGPPREACGNRPIRFGCFNRFDKLAPDCLSLWASILSASPGATLTFKDIFYGEEMPRRRILSAFAREKVDAGRIIFQGREPRSDYLAAFDRIDIALDPFPINGGVTTLDGLSRGVPAITLRGAQPNGRIGASILMQFGLTEFICDSREEYFDRAINFGRIIGAESNIWDSVAAAFARVSNPRVLGSRTREVEEAYHDLWSSRRR
jgi:protein O-GlcNAc transferase